MKPADAVFYIRAKRAGARYPRIVIEEARRTGVQLSLAFAVVEQETGGHNVYGHDPVKNPIKSPRGGLLKVTRSNYVAYKRHRQAGEGMQGVGPMQLTWYATQDLADREGGCWKPRFNIRIGLRQLAQNIRANGTFKGVAAYNGSGSAAQRYATSVLEKQQKWHRILEGIK
jgi:soluble lytic murein transglycosylase-like protein